MSDAAVVLFSLSSLLIGSCVMVFVSAYKKVHTETVSEIIEEHYRGLGFYTPEMTTEAGFNQPAEDCDYSSDETVYLKPGVYVKAYDFDELDPVFIRVILFPSNLYAVSDGCLKGGE